MSRPGLILLIAALLTTGCASISLLWRGPLATTDKAWEAWLDEEIAVDIFNEQLRFVVQEPMLRGSYLIPDPNLLYLRISYRSVACSRRQFWQHVASRHKLAVDLWPDRQHPDGIRIRRQR